MEDNALYVGERLDMYKQQHDNAFHFIQFHTNI